MIYNKNKKFSKKEIKSHLKGSPDYKIKNDIAIQMIKSNQIEKGAHLLYTAVKSPDLKDKIPYLNLARVFSLASNSEKLLETYTLLLAHECVNENEAFQMAKDLYADKREPESYHLVHSLFLSSPKNKITYAHYLAQIHMEKGEYANAVDFYGKILEIDPNNAEAHFSSGYIYTLGNDHERALVHLELAKKLGHRNAALYYFLAQTYAGKNRLNDALAAIRSIPQKDQDFNMLALHGDILLMRDYSSDISILLNGKNEEEKLKLLNHWFKTGYNENIPDRNPDSQKKDPMTGSRFILNTLSESKKEFLQLY